MLVFLLISLFISGCSNSDTTMNEETTSEDYDFYLPSITIHPAVYKENNSITEPYVVSDIPDNTGYPLSYGDITPDVYMVNNKIYFKSKGCIYESTSSSQDDCNTKSLDINNITDLLTDDTYLYCLSQKDNVLIYDPATNKNVCSIDLDKYFNDDCSFFILECVGDNKAYFAARRKSDQSYILFSLDQDGQINIEKTDTTYILKSYYSDTDYYVYSKRLSDNSDTHVYAENKVTGEVNEIYNKKLMSDRSVPTYRWNNSFVLLTTKGICVADADGSDFKEFKGNQISCYAFYDNKVYFTGQQLISFDLVTGEQKNYDYGADTDFSGNINISNGKLLLARYENSSKNLTVHVVSLS